MTREEMLRAIEALPEEIKERSDVRRILKNPEKISDNLIKRAYDAHCKDADPAMVAYQKYNSLYRLFNSFRDLKDGDSKGDLLALANQILDSSVSDCAELGAVCAKISAEMQELKPLAQEWAGFTGCSLINNR